MCAFIYLSTNLGGKKKILGPLNIKKRKRKKETSLEDKQCVRTERGIDI